MIKLQQTVLMISIALVGACAAPITTTDYDCEGANPGIVPININYNGTQITVAPDPQTADAGDVLRFNLVGSNNVRVSTSGKTPEAGWLNGSGKKKIGEAASNQFYVCVPTDLFDDEDEDVEEKDYEYNVNAVGKPQLDPKVRIIRK